MAEKGGHWVKSAGGGMSFKPAGASLSQADAEQVLYKLGLHYLKDKASRLAPTSGPNGWHWPKSKEAYESADAAWSKAIERGREILGRTEGIASQEYRWDYVLRRLSGL